MGYIANLTDIKTVLERAEPIFYDGVSFLTVLQPLTEISAFIRGRFLQKCPFWMGENGAGVVDKLYVRFYVCTLRRSKDLT